MKRYLAWSLALLIAVSGCAAPPASSEASGAAEASPSGTQAENGRVPVLRLAGGTDWGAPGVYLHASRGPGNAKKDLIFASLLEADEKGVVGWMAESWKVDGNNYTFTLHPDAKFHDGEPLTAEDVAFTIDYYRQFPPVNNPLGAGESFLISGYEVLDPQRIKISVNRSDAVTLTALGGFEILPKHIWELVEDPMTYSEPDAFIGSGAYCFSSYDGAAGSYEFTAFDGFCAGEPAADRIQFVPVSDELLAFENGEIDIAGLPADLFERYASDPSIGMIEKANDMGYKLLINFEKHPEFLELAMREGLYQALDRQAVVDKVFRGMGAAGSAGYAPPGSIYYNENCVQYPYEPEKAAALFAGKGISVAMIAANSGNDVKIAELVKNDLTAAGIEVEVVAYDSAVRDEMVNAGDYEFALVGNGGWGGKAPAYLRTIFSDLSKNRGGNPHSMGPIGYSSERITELAEAQQLETDFDRRVEIFQELQLEISREIPLVVIATQSSYSIYRKDYYDGWMKTYDYQQAEQNRLSYLKRG